MRCPYPPHPDILQWHCAVFSPLASNSFCCHRQQLLTLRSEQTAVGDSCRQPASPSAAGNDCWQDSPMNSLKITLGWSIKGTPHSGEQQQVWLLLAMTVDRPVQWTPWKLLWAEVLKVHHKVENSSKSDYCWQWLLTGQSLKTILGQSIKRTPQSGEQSSLHKVTVAGQS